MPVESLRHKLREGTITTSDGKEHEVLYTDHWTVVDPEWRSDWLMAVWKAEREVGRAICAYKTTKDKPCKNNPLNEENITDMKLAGRCNIHANPPEPKPQPVLQVREVEPSSVTQLPTSASFKELMRVADDLYTRCKICNIRYMCDKPHDTVICPDEKSLFTEIIAGMNTEYSLDHVLDQVSSFTLVTTIVDYIRTIRYERYKGREDSIESGNMGLRMQLARLIHQIMRSLAVDRRTRLILIKGDRSYMPGKDIAQLLSEISVDSLTAETRSIMTVTSVKTVPKREFVGSDGKPIIDIEASKYDE